MSKREVLEAVIALIATVSLVTAFVLASTGCKQATDTEKALVESMAEAAYYAQQLDCVERYDTRETIDRCRDDVRYRWRRGEYADAGLE